MFNGQYIDTGIVPNNDTGMLMKYSQNTTGDAVPMGARSSSGDRFYIPYPITSYQVGTGWNTFTRVGTAYFLGTPISCIASVNYLNDRKHIYIDSDLKETVFAIANNLRDIEVSIHLNGYNNNGMYRGSDPIVRNIYEAKISQDDEIICDLVPCEDNNGVQCFYDVVRNIRFDILNN